MQPNRPDELQYLLHDRVGHLGFRNDVGQHCLRIRNVRNLPAQQPRHHFDAGQWVLHLVRDGRRHLANGRQAIAKPLALLELLDAREVLEEHRHAGDLSRIVADERERVADHFPRRPQPRFGAVRQQMQLKSREQLANDVGVGAEHFGNRFSQVVGARLHAKNPVALLVQQRNRACSRNREHPVAHPRDDVPEEGVGGLRPARTGQPVATRSGAAGACHWRRQLDGAKTNHGGRRANDVPELNSDESVESADSEVFMSRNGAICITIL